MRFKGCLIAGGVALALVAVLASVFGPRLAREAGRFVTPISKMKASQTQFEKWADEHPWQAPATPDLSAERLDVFLKLRRTRHKLESEIEIPQPGSRAEKPKLSDMPQMFEGIGGLVGGQLEAYVQAGMTPKEYHYLERLIYRTWLGALRHAGEDPAARARAAAEIEAAAEGERDAAVKSRLRDVAKRVTARTPPAPEGVPESVHALLLSRAPEIQSLAESTSPFPMRPR